MNIAIFASHGGSDLQAIMDGCKNNQMNAKVAVVISNNGSSMALQRAADEGVPNYHLSAEKSGSEEYYRIGDEIEFVNTKTEEQLVVSVNI
ncbi:MAG: hypothetical protein K2N73_03285 [Lachnospiraceae bacterium]|nr:hypothetical protein [Lachnospiraceae bacterium]